PHILDILAHHGLVGVRVDLDPASLTVDARDVASLVTPRTQAILVAHLFGSRMPIGPLAQFARDRSLLLIEDCAQANDGRYRGHPESDVRLFSFGSIKRQTALGGGILSFRDAGLAAAVREHVGRYPVQPRRDFARRVAT